MASRLHRQCTGTWLRVQHELDERPIDRFDRGIWGMGVSLEVRRVWAIEERALLRRNGCRLGVYGRELPRRLAHLLPIGAEPDPRTRIRQRIEQRLGLRGARGGLQRHGRALPVVSDRAPAGPHDEARGDALVNSSVHATATARLLPGRFRSCRVVSGRSLRRRERQDH